VKAKEASDIGISAGECSKAYHIKFKILCTNRSVCGGVGGGVLEPENVTPDSWVHSYSKRRIPRIFTQFKLKCMITQSDKVKPRYKHLIHLYSKPNEEVGGCFL
jgi:hypothetical protein